MNRKLIVTNYKGGIALALFADRRAVELVYEETGEASLLGNIYVGRVAKIAKNISAAFVEIENGISCYYSLKENPDPIYASAKKSSRLCIGDEILVQVSRESVKTKQPSVTSNLSISGRYLVLTTGKRRIAVSSKLDADRREKLLAIAGELADERFGWIVRTNAADAGREALFLEAERLRATYERILNVAPHRQGRSCLCRNPEPWLLRIRDIYDQEYEQILTDDDALYQQMREYLADVMPDRLEKLSFYHDHLLPLFKLYPVDLAFEETARERIW